MIIVTAATESHRAGPGFDEHMDRHPAPRTIARGFAAGAMVARNDQGEGPLAREQGRGRMLALARWLQPAAQDYRV